FPDLKSPPSLAAARIDMDAAVRVSANAVNVVFVPGASTLAIDSVARALGMLPRDSLFVIATIGYGGKLLPELKHAALDADARLATLRRVLERLRPDMV